MRIQVPKDVKQSDWFATLPSREKECLGYSLFMAKVKEVALTTVGGSQRMDRLAEGQGGVVPTLTGSTRNWVVPAECSATGQTDESDGDHQKRPRTKAAEAISNRLTLVRSLAVAGVDVGERARTNAIAECSVSNALMQSRSAYHFCKCQAWYR